MSIISCLYLRVTNWIGIILEFLPHQTVTSSKAGHKRSFQHLFGFTLLHKRHLRVLPFLFGGQVGLLPQGHRQRKAAGRSWSQRGSKSCTTRGGEKERIVLSAVLSYVLYLCYTLRSTGGTTG